MKIGTLDTDRMTVEEMETLTGKVTELVALIVRQRIKAAQQTRQDGTPAGSILRPTTPSVN